MGAECRLCCKETNERPDVAPCASCGDQHASYCLPCWKDWIEACENRRASAPNCPNCRSDLDDTAVQSVLGRSYTVRDGCELSDDAATLAVLSEEEQAMFVALGFRSCPRCHAWIERESGTCAAMQCLCGQRFCYECNEVDGSCRCGRLRWCEFYDNVTREHSGYARSTNCASRRTCRISATAVAAAAAAAAAAGDGDDGGGGGNSGSTIRRQRRGTGGVWVRVGAGRWVLETPSTQAMTAGQRRASNDL